VLTENREEVDIKIQDDDMGERAQEIGLLMGDEDPRMTQTAAAQREAEALRNAALVGDGDGEGAVAVAEDEEEEPEEEIDDSKPIATGPLGGTMGTAEADTQVAANRGTAEFEMDELAVDAPEEETVEEEEDDEGYVLEDEEEEYTEEPESFEEEEAPMNAEEEF